MPSKKHVIKKKKTKEREGGSGTNSCYQGFLALHKRESLIKTFESKRVDLEPWDVILYLLITVLLLHRFGVRGLVHWAHYPCPSRSSLGLTSSAWTAGLHSTTVKGRCY